MASYSEVFERKEVKYRLGAERASRLQEALADRMAPDIFGTSQVTSLYYDTPERALIERSLDKPVYKEKLRVRWYGHLGCSADTPAYLELKKKFKGIVYERSRGVLLWVRAGVLGRRRRLRLGRCGRRLRLGGREGDFRMGTLTLTWRNRQVIREIESFRRRTGRLCALHAHQLLAHRLGAASRGR